MTVPTLRHLQFKPDFDRTVDRFAAWWEGAVLDRPPVTLSVHASRPYRGPAAAHATQRERWLDAEYNVAAAIAHMERTDYLGDSFPAFSPNVGPEITATLLGCELEFGPTTSWSTPVVHDPAQWHALATRAPDFNNPHWRAMEQATALALEQCDGRYIVGLTDLHDSFDMLAALRDPQALCMDLLDDPEPVRRVAHHAAHVFAEAFARSRAPLAAAGMGSTCWAPFYHEGPAYIPSCDFWCMISPDMARDLVVPTKAAEMAGLERSIFHLDGPQALKHLDTTLALPGLNALQWVQGAGQGPARAWLHVYRRALEAGKSVQVLAHDAGDALAVLEALGPAGVWLHVGAPFATAGEAEAFLAEVTRRSAQPATTRCG